MYFIYGILYICQFAGGRVINRMLFSELQSSFHNKTFSWENNLTTFSLSCRCSAVFLSNQVKVSKSAQKTSLNYNSITADDNRDMAAPD